MKRRTFIKAAAAAAAAPYVARAIGAGDRIRMGFIGVGNRGSQLLQSFILKIAVEGNDVSACQLKLAG